MPKLALRDQNRKIEPQPTGCLVTMAMDALSGHGTISSGHGTTSNIVFAKQAYAPSDPKLQTTASAVSNVPTFKPPRVRVDLVQIRSQARKADAATEHPYGRRAAISARREQSSFPVVCLKVVRQTIATPIDEHATRDTSLIFNRTPL